MERTRFIDHQGHRILLFDYSEVRDVAEALREVEKSKAIVAQQPPNSLLTIVYVKGSRFNTEVVQALKDLAAHNKPYVKAGAVVGMSGLHRVVYQAVMLFSKRKLAVFEEIEAAKEWLIEQA
jgi:hypothetical protein